MGNRKPCNCTKSMCLKLYCDCFANGEFCKDCNCKDCRNNLENEAERTRAVKLSLERNPNAFKPKIGRFFFLLLNFMTWSSFQCVGVISSFGTLFFFCMLNMFALRCCSEGSG